MERLRSGYGAGRSLEEREHLERARSMFERRAGKPVSAAEAQEWLDVLVDFYRIVERWVIEEAEEADAGRPQDVQQGGRDIPALPAGPVPRRIASRRKAREPRLDARDIHVTPGQSRTPRRRPEANDA